MKNKWQSKVDALIRLADDQKGKPEGDLAREKLLIILQNHPEAVIYKPILDLAWRDISTKDVVTMHRMGTSTDGSWTGVNLQDAVYKMMQDYHRRMVAAAFGIPLKVKEIKDERPVVGDDSSSTGSRDTSNTS